jgi:Pyruvate/2-oxoacid:ferredoxin oxidoreductase delta subunit
LESIKKRQPYGTERWTGVSRALMDWVCKTLYGYQVLPDLESACKVIDLANEIGLGVCECHQTFSENPEEKWRCIALNNAARITFKHNTHPCRVISKEEAKLLVAEQRERGCFQSVGWRLGANVVWLCNCDEYCGAHRTPELEWDMIPSFFVAEMSNPDKCMGCRVCIQWCHRGSIGADADGRAEIDGVRCLGCGQCVEHCPEHALALVPRQEYYDLSTRRKVKLPSGTMQI